MKRTLKLLLSAALISPIAFITACNNTGKTNNPKKPSSTTTKELSKEEINKIANQIKITPYLADNKAIKDTYVNEVTIDKIKFKLDNNPYPDKFVVEIIPNSYVMPNSYTQSGQYYGKANFVYFVASLKYVHSDGKKASLRNENMTIEKLKGWVNPETLKKAHVDIKADKSKITAHDFVENYKKITNYKEKEQFIKDNLEVGSLGESLKDYFQDFEIENNDSTSVIVKIKWYFWGINSRSSSGSSPEYLQEYIVGGFKKAPEGKLPDDYTDDQIKEKLKELNSKLKFEVKNFNFEKDYIDKLTTKNIEVILPYGFSQKYYKTVDLEIKKDLQRFDWGLLYNIVYVKSDGTEIKYSNTKTYKRLGEFQKSNEVIEKALENLEFDYESKFKKDNDTASVASLEISNAITFDKGKIDGIIKILNNSLDTTKFKMVLLNSQNKEEKTGRQIRKFVIIKYRLETLDGKIYSSQKTNKTLWEYSYSPW